VVDLLIGCFGQVIRMASEDARPLSADAVSRCAVPSRIMLQPCLLHSSAAHAAKTCPVYQRRSAAAAAQVGLSQVIDVGRVKLGCANAGP
jgi:hypothetical protein